ncbi:sulfatase [Lewinella sp. 4G2]|uniref:sulfatase n=1 Tax=Lewinella sp. 4G2 TaxID=1803372 RepID=UPI0007B4A3AE|nr:sulfatase [Lewinella sp. 4G2]OAV44173.1 hypothetical protein A3850_006535 [Lewinella sp. 4G2]
MPLRPLLTLCAILSLAAACTPDIAPAAAPANDTLDAPTKNQPNILLIVADDLGWADLNCYGSHLIESPNLDKLARNGIQFMQGYAAAPVCSPSRASIQTGIHPARIGMTEHLHGYYDNGKTALIPPRIPQGLALDYTTLGELAASAGYRTAHVGKWHLGNDEYAPDKQGYEITYAGGRYGLPRSFYHPFFDGEPFPDLLANTEPGDYLTDALGDKTLELLEEWGEEPWLISLNFYAPHVPIQGRQDWVDYYQMVIDSSHWRPFPTIEYAAMVSTLDENVGRITSYLEAEGRLKNTLIVFVSDNGGLHVREVPGYDQHTPPTDNGILRAGKGYVYEGGIRVPFLLHYPALATGQAASLTPVVTNDIFPTVAAAIGRERDYNGKDGLNLLPLLSGKDLPRRNLYWHFPHYSPQGGTPAAAVRSGDYKLYYDYEAAVDTYYNVAALPGENRMLAGPPEGGDLLEALQEWKREVGAVDATRR